MTTTRLPRHHDQQTIERLLAEGVGHFGKDEFDTVVTALASQLGIPHITLPDTIGSGRSMDERIREVAVQIAMQLEAKGSESRRKG